MYKTYFNYIRTIVRNIIKDDPDDIAQITFVKLSQCDYAKNEAIAKTFIYQTSIRMCIDHLRNKKNRQRREQQWHINEYGATDEPYAHINTIEEIEAEIERAKIQADVLLFIYQQIESLPGNCKKIFKQFYFDKKTIDQISSDLNIKPHTVHSQLARARKTLKIEILFNKKSVLQLLAKRPTL